MTTMGQRLENRQNNIIDTGRGTIPLKTVEQMQRETDARVDTFVPVGTDQHLVPPERGEVILGAIDAGVVDPDSDSLYRDAQAANFDNYHSIPTFRDFLDDERVRLAKDLGIYGRDTEWYPGGGNIGSEFDRGIGPLYEYGGFFDARELEADRGGPMTEERLRDYFLGGGTSGSLDDALPTEMFNRSQVGEMMGRYGSILALEDSFKEVEGAYGSSMGSVDEAERVSQRASAQRFSRGRSSGMQRMARRGLAGSSLTEAYEMSSLADEAAASTDIAGQFAAQRAQIEQNKANQMVSLLTGNNIGGGLNPESAFDMARMYGESGSGQEPPDVGGLF